MKNSVQRSTVQVLTASRQQQNSNPGPGGPKSFSLSFFLSATLSIAQKEIISQSD